MLTRRRFLAQSTASAFALPRLWSKSPPHAVVDAHVHVFEHNPRFAFAPGAHPPAEDAPPEKLIALMQANRVARTVIVQIIHYKWDNSYLADVLRRYPTLFQGVCRVNPEDPAAPDQLSRLTEQGFRGVRLSPAADASGDWILGALMPPLWRRCAELKVPMTLLVPATRLPDLVPLIEANPETGSNASSIASRRSASCGPPTGPSRSPSSPTQRSSRSIATIWTFSL